jgi:hypothetical protein
MTQVRLSPDGRSITVRVPMQFVLRGGRKLVNFPEGAQPADLLPLVSITP